MIPKGINLLLLLMGVSLFEERLIFEHGLWIVRPIHLDRLDYIRWGLAYKIQMEHSRFL